MGKFTKPLAKHMAQYGAGLQELKDNPPEKKKVHTPDAAAVLPLLPLPLLLMCSTCCS